MAKKKRALRPFKKHFVGGRFLHPQSVNSAVRFTVSATQHGVDGYLYLSDCSRVISWGEDNYGNDGGSLDVKLRHAIQIMQNARVAISKARKYYKDQRAKGVFK